MPQQQCQSTEINTKHSPNQRLGIVLSVDREDAY